MYSPRLFIQSTPLFTHYALIAIPSPAVEDNLSEVFKPTSVITCFKWLIKDDP